MAMLGRAREGVVSKIVVTALAAACLFAAATCSSEQQMQKNAGAGGQTTAVSGGGGSGIGGGIVIIATDAAALTPPSGLVFPDPPLISCDASAANGGGCDFAPSACEIPACDDAGSCTATRWMKAYANPRCIAGQCVWDPAFYYCQDLCVNGRCLYNGTTLP